MAISLGILTQHFQTNPTGERHGGENPSGYMGIPPWTACQALPPAAQSCPCWVAPRTMRRHLSARASRQRCRAIPWRLSAVQKKAFHNGEVWLVQSQP